MVYKRCTAISLFVKYVLEIFTWAVEIFMSVDICIDIYVFIYYIGVSPMQFNNNDFIIFSPVQFNTQTKNRVLYSVQCTDKNHEKILRKRQKFFPNFFQRRIFLAKLANFSHDFLTIFVSVYTNSPNATSALYVLYLVLTLTCCILNGIDTNKSYPKCSLYYESFQNSQINALLN